MLITQLSAEKRFKEMQDDGTIVYEGEDDDTGRSLFMVTMSDSTRYHCAFETEVINYIKTASFNTTTNYNKHYGQTRKTQKVRQLHLGDCRFSGSCYASRIMLNTTQLMPASRASQEVK